MPTAGMLASLNGILFAANFGAGKLIAHSEDIGRHTVYIYCPYVVYKLYLQEEPLAPQLAAASYPREECASII